MRAPWIFAALYKVISPFLAADTKRKVRILGKGDDHLKALSEYMGVKKFETTADGTFTLGEMECMGCCVNAPMIAVADYTGGVAGYSYNYYEDLTPEDAVAVCKALKKGEKPRVGSQHRDKAEPKTGQTTLTSEPRGPHCRDLAQVKAELEEAAAAAAKVAAEEAAAKK